MRILVIQPTGDKMGHYGIYTVRLCQALGELGHSVTLCTNKVYPERYVSEPLAFDVEEVHGGKLSFETFDRAVNSRPWHYFWGYFRNSYVVTSEALKLCRSGDFDLVYIMDAEFLLASLLLKWHGGRIPPVAMYVSAANFSFRDYPGSVLKKLYKVFQREIFKRTLGREIRAISVLGEWHKERLRSQLELPSHFPIVVIPDAGGEPPLLLSRTEARQRLGIEYGGPVLLFFGMLRKDKGIEDLIEAVADVQSEEFRLVMAGHAMEYAESEIIDMVQKAGVEDKVILRLGYVDDADVPLYLWACDALILPYANSYTGGSGPLMKQAATYGKPIIASDVSEMGRLIRRYGIGLVSTPGDPRSLAGRIREFHAMPQMEKQHMGKRSAALATSNSWDVMAERFTNLFEDVVGVNTP